MFYLVVHIHSSKPLVTTDNYAADLDVVRVIEGNASIACKSMKAKMVNGDNVQVQVHGHLELGSAYSKKVTVTVHFSCTFTLCL